MNNSIFKPAMALLLALPLMAIPVQASEVKPDMGIIKKSLVVSNAWIRLMPSVASSTAAYFTLENQSDKSIEIVTITTAIAKKSTMHDTIVENDMASMIPLDELNIASGSSVVFAPGGKHLMIMGLTEKLVKNKNVSLYFELKNGEQIVATMQAYKNNPHSEDSEEKPMQHKPMQHKHH
jgi:copper(I)-binding protein